MAGTAGSARGDTSGAAGSASRTGGSGGLDAAPPLPEDASLADAPASGRDASLTGSDARSEAGADARAAIDDSVGRSLQSAFVWGSPTDKAVVFRKTFALLSATGPVRVHIFADARYALWVNGTYVVSGPSRFDPKAPQFDTVDVTGAVHAGSNTIAVLAYAITDQVSGQHMRHPGGLTLLLSSESATLATDSTWKASATTRFGAPTVAWQNVTENVDATREYDCLAENFDDTSWPAATSVSGTSWGALTPRDIPLLQEKVLAAQLPFPVPADTASFDVRFDKSYVVAVELDFEASAGTTIDIFGNKYRARAGRQLYRTIDTFGIGLNGVPSAHVTTSGTIRVHGIRFINRVYPFAARGSFTSSDANLDRLWNTSVHTIQQVSEDGYEDCPWERAEWMGDGAIVHYPVTRVALAGPDDTFGDARLIRKMLKNIAESQQTDGRLKAHAPSDRFDIHGYIEDYACLWVQTLRQYDDNTSDRPFVASMWPALTQQMALLAAQKQPSGLLRGREFTIFDNPVVYQVLEGATLNAFYYKALRDGAELATRLGKTVEAANYAKSADDLAAAFNAALWDGSAYKASTTVTATGAGRWYAGMIALSQGIVPTSRAPALRQALAANAAALSNTLYPYTHHWLFADLYDMDTPASDKLVLDRIRARWSSTFASGNQGGVTNESFGPRNFHNFGASAAYFLAANVLGVTLAGPASAHRLVLQPRLGDLGFARGVVVTEHGLVPVSWTRDANNALTFSFTIPAGVTAEVLLPSDNGAQIPTVTRDGQPQPVTLAGRYASFEVGAGNHSGVLNP